MWHASGHLWSCLPLSLLLDSYHNASGVHLSLKLTSNWVSTSGLLHLLFLLPGRLVPQMLPSFESLSCHLVVTSPKRLPWPSYLNCHHLSLSNLLPCFVFHHSACHYRSFMFIYCCLPPVQNLSTMRIRFCLFYSLLCSQCWELWLTHGRYSI